MSEGNSDLDSFVAIDVETANADLASICQIGIAKFNDGRLVEEWSSLIDPEDYFDFYNQKTHGISKQTVAGAPKFPEIVEKLNSIIEGNVCVCHTHFDKVALHRATWKYEIPQFDYRWLDSASVARKAWADCSQRGYGLGPLCERIGYEFKHHDALEDAKAAGWVLLAALRELDTNVSSWMSAPGTFRRGVRRDGDPDGKLSDQVIVFTGALTLPRNQASILAASVGCTVAEIVTKKTTLLVVGDQDLSKLAGKEHSAKHLKALKLIDEGIDIRILKESDFLELVKMAQE